jgi:hypothetical protein
MGLEQELADFQAEFQRLVPGGRAAVHDTKVEEPRAIVPLDAGTQDPNLTLPDAHGGMVSPSDTLAQRSIGSDRLSWRRASPSQYSPSGLSASAAEDHRLGCAADRDPAAATRPVAVDRRTRRALPGIDSDESWELPLPATYAAAGGRVAPAFVEIDYRRRLAPEDIIALSRGVRRNAA